MSWFAAVNTSSTRSNNPNFTSDAREQRRANLEAERLLKKQKSEQRKQLAALGVSAPSSPSLSRANTPPPENSDRIIESAPNTPIMPDNGGGGGGGNPPGGGPPPGGPGGPSGPPGGGPPGGPGNQNLGGGHANQNQNPNDEVDFELEDGRDGARAAESSGRILLQINLEDITFWFSEFESEMQLSELSGPSGLNCQF